MMKISVIPSLQTLLIIFLASFIFFVFIIPKVISIFDKYNELIVLNESVSYIKRNIGSIKADSINFSKYNAINKAIDISAKETQSELLKFRDNLLSIASRLDIKFLNEKFNESSIQTNNMHDIFSLRETSFQLVLEGGLNNLVNFIDTLEKYDQIIIIRDMELSQSNVSISRWNLKLTISRFSFGLVQKDFSVDDVDYSTIILPSSVEKFLLKLK